VVRQDEDEDFDGRIDRRFEGAKQVPLEGRPEAPEALRALDCGSFDSFWKIH